MQGITRIPEFDQKTVRDSGNVKWVGVWLLPAKRDSSKFGHGYGIWKENDIQDSDDISSRCGIPVKGAGTRDQDIPFQIPYHNYNKGSSKGDNRKISSRLDTAWEGMPGYWLLALASTLPIASLFSPLAFHRSTKRMVVSAKKIQKFRCLAKTIWDNKIPTRTPSHQEV